MFQRALPTLSYHRAIDTNCYSYLLGQGLGGIVFPPYSESFGRKKLYIFSASLYSVFCLVIAAVPSIPSLVVGRFITGFLSAIPTVVITGSIEDMFNTHDRIFVMLVYVSMACMGVSAGPIISSYISVRFGWWETSKPFALRLLTLAQEVGILRWRYCLGIPRCASFMHQGISTVPHSYAGSPNSA